MKFCYLLPVWIWGEHWIWEGGERETVNEVLSEAHLMTWWVSTKTWWRHFRKLVWGQKFVMHPLCKSSLGMLRYLFIVWIYHCWNAWEWQTSDLGSILITSWSRDGEEGGIWLSRADKGLELLLIFYYLSWEVGIHILDIFSS